jgi:hypothetical protein
MSKTDSIRAFPEDIEYFRDMIDDRTIVTTAQAVRVTIEKAEKHDEMVNEMSKNEKTMHQM